MQSALTFVVKCLAVIAISFLMMVSPATASGEVKLIMDGSTYYLSTTATGSATTATVSAARTASISAEELANPPQGYFRSFTEMISFALQLIMVIGLLLVLFSLVMAGIEWITSGGDKGKTESARNRIVAAIVGIIILAASYALVQLVAYVLGYASLNDAIQSMPQINS